jgi:hypothetical protein
MSKRISGAVFHEGSDWYIYRKGDDEYLHKDGVWRITTGYFAAGNPKYRYIAPGWYRTRREARNVLRKYKESLR